MEDKNLFFMNKGETSVHLRLKTLMRDRNMKTFQELANKVGVSRSMISQIANNAKIPTIEMKLKIANVLGCDSRVIFPDEKEVNDNERNN